MGIKRTMIAGFALVAAASAPAVGAGPLVWSGDDFFFEKDNFADSKLPENQDRITGSVWLTRDNGAGIYNRATESIYTSNMSPADTEWATGSASNWQSLTFTTWEEWFGGSAGGGPESIVDVDAVVHLISDDIYIDIRFESWTRGSNGGGPGGGGFSYSRASNPTPSENVSWGEVKAHGESSSEAPTE